MAKRVTRCSMGVQNHSENPTGKTPFKLAYGSEAVIPAEVHMANHRVMMYQDKDNEEQLRLNLDLIDKVRADVEHKAAKYKNLMARQYDAMVKPRHFNIGDHVLRKVLAQIRKDPIKLSTVKGKDLTTWRPWTGENWNILGMWST